MVFRWRADGGSTLNAGLQLVALFNTLGDRFMAKSCGGHYALIYHIMYYVYAEIFHSA